MARAGLGERMSLGDSGSFERKTAAVEKWGPQSIGGDADFY